MMYPFLTLDDASEIVHSEFIEKGNKRQVKVYVEKPDCELGFRSAWCYLPDCQWQDINGFSKEKIEYLTKLIKAVEHVIYDRIPSCEQKRLRPSPCSNNE